MIRPIHMICLCLLLSLPLWAAEVSITPETTSTEVEVVTGGATVAKPDPSGRVTITIVSTKPGNLFLPTEPASFAVRLVNPGAADRVALTTRVATAHGALVSTETLGIALPEKGEVTQEITVEGERRLPYGPYRIDVWVQGTTAYGYGTTLFGVWPGPAKAPYARLGISYQGPLDQPRTWADLDLLRQAGVSWIRFPLKGWLPQGTMVPPECEVYRTFLREAADRQFSLLAAFTPTTTVDPAVNPDRAEKEYRESLLAAATHFGPQIAFWELLRVKPDPLYPELRGIRPPDLGRGRAALLAFNKKARAIFSLEAPFVANAHEYAAVGLPYKDDVLALRYNFIGLPETQDANPKPPLFELEGINGSMKGLLKRTPPVWVTEYGFDPTKGERLPAAPYQAALMARAYLLNGISGVERTFWRHNPEAQYDLPFTTATGAAQPGLLALRHLADRMEGATLVKQVTAPAGMQAYIFGQGDVSKKGRKGGKARFFMVIWAERMATAVTMKTSESRVVVSDLWGNNIELNPVDNATLFTVDEFPRFVDLGGTDDIEILNPFAHFSPARVVLKPYGENRFVFNMLNDPRVFGNKHVFEVRFRRWPGTEEVKMVEAPFQSMYDRHEWAFPLSIPPNAHKGQVYEVTADLLIGSRRVGFLTLPVWYSPEE